MKLTSTLAFIFFVFVSIALIVTNRTEHRSSSKAYSTKSFRESLDRDQIVFITFSANWDSNAKHHNMYLCEAEEWVRFFGAPSHSLMLYDRTNGINHQELADLKDGAGNGLLAVYSRKLGSRPLITFLGHLQVGHLEELADFITSKSTEELLSIEEYETKLMPSKIFSRNIPLRARGPDPR